MVSTPLGLGRPLGKSSKGSFIPARKRAENRCFNQNTRSSSGRNNGKVFSPFLLAQKNPLLFMQQPAEKLPLNLRRGCVWLEDIATCHAQPNLSCALASCFQILVIVFNGQHMSERCCVCIPCVLLVFM